MATTKKSSAKSNPAAIPNVFYSVSVTEDWDGDPGFCWGICDNLNSVKEMIREVAHAGEDGGDTYPKGWEEDLVKWWPGPTPETVPDRLSRDFTLQAEEWNEDRYVVVTRHVLNK
jgi:hypothetical protein